MGENANTPNQLKQRATLALEPGARYGKKWRTYLARKAEGASTNKPTDMAPTCWHVVMCVSISPNARLLRIYNCTHRADLNANRHYTTRDTTVSNVLSY